MGYIRTNTVRAISICLIGMLLVGSRQISSAYSVLSHEEIIDLLWQEEIKRVLLEHYPATTPEELRLARAYAYGGALIQDMGYYPSGNRMFSDLVHYVRTGDFVTEMIRDAHNVNELAFALGALAHYKADVIGHPFVNRAVSLSFPKLRKKYGDEVTYAEDHKAHIRTEFGFDVLEVSQQHFSSQSYHDFIGFEVARPLLDRAFLHTYGIELSVLLPDEDRAIMDFRHALSVWIPRFTEVALITKRDELQASPDFNPKLFRYHMHRREFEKEWGKNYDHPGFFSKFLAVVVRVLPKVGGLKTLDVKVPDGQTEKMFVTSMEKTVASYHDSLLKLGLPALSQVSDSPTRLADLDLDTGKPVAPAEYSLTDSTYAKLLKLLSKDHYSRTSPALRADILHFYSDLTPPLETKRHAQQWKDLQREIEELRSQPQTSAEEVRKLRPSSAQ